MSFATGVATKVVLWLLVLYFWSAKFCNCGGSKKCIDEECGGNAARIRAERKGEALCSQGGRGLPATACWLKCRGEKSDEDQLQCWKNRCAAEYGRGFCEKPGMDSIKTEQCEEYLNEGKAKFYGRACPDYFIPNNKTVNY